MRTETPIPIKLEDYRPYPFAIDTIELEFNLDPKATQVVSRLRVRRKAPGDMVLNGIGLQLKRLLCDGDTIPENAFTLTDESLTLSGLPDTFTLEIEVEIAPDENTALSGLYVSGGRLCTQCEADGFRRITYWPDRPDVMSRFSVRLVADATAYPTLLSNGTPGDTGRDSEGRHFAEWTDPHPKPSYLFALCAGEYDVYRDSFQTQSGDDIALAIYVDRGDSDRAAYAMDSLKRAMRWDEEVYGREYDLGVFNIVAVRDFNFGAMENKGLNIFNSAYVLADERTATDSDFEAIESIVAHEYFHNWTGNRITCRDWFQLCLKEGLTVFRDQEFSADMRSRAVQRIRDVLRLRARQFAEDAGPLAHAVRPDAYASVDNLYTATVYEKGAELIRMLKRLIGDASFAKGMDLYFNRFDGTAATIEDFYACFAEASGQDLTAFMGWYRQPGTPHIHVRHTYDTSTGRGEVRFDQSNPSTPVVKSPEPLPVPISWALLDGEGGHCAALDDAAERTTLVDAAEIVATYQVAPGTQRPGLSLNRQFSAPIRITTDLSFADRIDLVRAETDTFARWDLLQALITEDILAMAYQDKPQPDDLLVESLTTGAVDVAETDPAYAALVLSVPSVPDLFLAHSPANPGQISRARDRMRTAISEHATILALSQDILTAPSPTPFAPSAEQAGVRSLRTVLIGLLAARTDQAADAQLESLFADAPNMTEQLACLKALAESQGSNAPAFTTFHAQWSHQPLVIDKWFQVRALYLNSGSDLTALTEHPDFNLSNPNRVRAAAGVFATQNLRAFHAPDGSGYDAIVELATAADKRNPALAARMLTAFEQWRSLTPKLRDRAKLALEQLTRTELSKTAGDIVTRALGGG